MVTREQVILTGVIRLRAAANAGACIAGLPFHSHSDRPPLGPLDQRVVQFHIRVKRSLRGAMTKGSKYGRLTSDLTISRGPSSPAPFIIPGEVCLFSRKCGNTSKTPASHSSGWNGDSDIFILSNQLPALNKHFLGPF